MRKSDVISPSTSAVVSAGIVFVLLSAVDLAKRYNIPVTVPPVVLSLVGAASVFAALYWIFDRYLWRLPLLRPLSQGPKPRRRLAVRRTDPSIPTSRQSFQWNATVTIAQSWDKIRLRLATSTSTSDSVAAALLSDAIDGFHLLYHYKNTPSITSTDLSAHREFAELTFAKDVRTATGEYLQRRRPLYLRHTQADQDLTCLAISISASAP